MSVKLCAYQIEGKTLGTQILSWNENDLNGNSPFYVAYDGVVPNGYIDITSIENWHKFGDLVLSSYQDKHRAIKLAFYNKGWENCTPSEKDIVIQYYANPDLGNNNQNTQVITYLLQKGYSLDEATDYLVDCWHNHWQKFVLECPERFKKVTKIVLKYLSFYDASDLDLTVETLKNRYLTCGILGIGYGDHKVGILNYVWSNYSYSGCGLEEKGYFLKKGTWSQFKQEIEDTLIDTYFWPEIKAHLQTMN